ncbi:ammonia-forming cytochrome c nitrite reductase subunit c552 [Halodesulfovibrio aestuarii]|uniref:nitrite reductase (cytochrome; ammonia-forming) n=1 Tax=Halodesulfovibrio aestuarii TaxID=126333 RepID=A0ABV4JZA2_9BACT
MKKNIIVIAGSIAIAAALMWLALDINTKKIEKVALTTVEGEPSDPAKSSTWKQLYPRQYETWASTRDSSEWEDMIETTPEQVIMRADPYSPTGPELLNIRGHYYSVIDFLTADGSGIPSEDGKDDTTSRCLRCHTSNARGLMERDGKMEFLSSSWTKYGSEALNPIGCVNCHDPKTAKLRMGPTGVDEMLTAAGLPDFNHSSHQEKRALICAQCHFEAYTETVGWKDKKGNSREATVTRTPWKNGFTLDDMERFYDDGSNFSSGKPYYDFIHPISKTPIIFSEHPDYELFKQGPHGKNGLACADCHMPYKQEGGVKFTDHKIGCPLDAIDRTCQTCHRKKEQYFKDVVAEKKKRKDMLADIAMKNLTKAHLEAGKAWEAGATEEEMAPVLADIRSSFWKWNSVARAAYFHAPEQTLKALADSNNKAQSARLALASILVKHGVTDYVAPEFKTKEEALSILSLPHRKEYMQAKCKFYETLAKKWVEDGKANGTYDEDISYPANMESRYTRECQQR